MKLCRIFLKPAGQSWCDMQLMDGQSAQTVFSAMRTEGAIVHPVFFIPTESIHYVLVLEIGGGGLASWTPPAGTPQA